MWQSSFVKVSGSKEDYKTYILSLLFFKRLSDNYPWEIESRIKQFKADSGVEPNAKQRELIISKAHDFIIPEGFFWNDVKNATAEKKNARLDEAVNKIADANPALKGIINSVRWNEPAPDGSGGKRIDPELLTSLINYKGSRRLAMDHPHQYGFKVLPLGCA